MASFAFAWDGQVDMMSVNPLEMTNFEMTGAVFGIAAVLIVLVWNMSRHGNALGPVRRVDVFTRSQAEDGQLD
ncbi:MAG: hypothetical protein RIS94_1692 [Pseudomonadota bacterium]|jgi:hypothetical protein